MMFPPFIQEIHDDALDLSKFQNLVPVTLSIDNNQ
jgi:hypothetical protein